MRFGTWRLALLTAGVLCAAGGAAHPRGGDLVEMLGSPRWVPAHLVLLVGLALLTWLLIDFARVRRLAGAVRIWTTLAIVAVGLEVIEMVLHTAAAVDHANAVAGRATPVLDAHLALAHVAYPIFGVGVAGFIAVAAAMRTLGSRWLAPLGMVGALAYGFAPMLTSLFPGRGFGILFPMFLLFALWLILTAAVPGEEA